MIEVSEQINAVTRTIGTRTLEAGQARVLTIAQTYPSPVEDVWDACTNIERIPRWFLPVTGDLRPGGRFQLEGNAGGTIERCDPPKSFAATWEFGGEVSWIEVRLTPAPDGGTRLELEHVAHVNDELWAQYGPGAVGIGWDGALMGLALHLTTGRTVDQQEAAAWMTSPEGLRFYRESSERWREASVRAGTDPQAAREAADRVLAFYTTPPEQS
ncbi:SRPBCC family protein [Actinomadura keratinilytica]|jgi:uncharacterized protein YndB with AHSA1/START domain|uniref:SRPBCC family protein n=1 Tax=Actinomadura keratinilytica TaxID=547461 RepID=A0ABP7Z2B9_9ACTN